MCIIKAFHTHNTLERALLALESEKYLLQKEMESKDFEIDRLRRTVIRLEKKVLKNEEAE